MYWYRGCVRKLLVEQSSESGLGQALALMFFRKLVNNLSCKLSYSYPNVHVSRQWYGGQVGKLVTLKGLTVRLAAQMLLHVLVGKWTPLFCCGRKVDHLWSESGPPVVGKWTTLMKSFGFMPIMSIVVTSIMLSVQNGVMDIIRFPLVFL